MNDDAQAPDFIIPDSVFPPSSCFCSQYIHFDLLLFCLLVFFRCAYIQSVGRVGWVLHLRKNAGLRRQAASHLQHPRGPAEVSRLLSVSEARVWSVDMEEMSLMEGEGGRLSLLFTAAPALRESTAARGLQRKRVPAKTGAQKQL